MSWRYVSASSFLMPLFPTTWPPPWHKHPAPAEKAVSVQKWEPFDRCPYAHRNKVKANAGA
jgi:hypothetical protein